MTHWFFRPLSCIAHGAHSAMQHGLAWLHQAVPRMWLRRGSVARLLWPLSLLYGWLWRRKWQRSQQMPAPTLPVPVLVIGNVIAGGAGKTPTTIAVVQHLVSRGIQVGIISRGYGRNTDGKQVSIVGYMPNHISTEHPLKSLFTLDAAQCGDEPLLMHQRTGVPVGVCANRHHAAELLLQAFPHIQMLVCDDGLQHLALSRQGEICVLDERGIGNGWLLPAGPLREPWPRVVTMVLHSAPPPDSLSYVPGQRVYRAQRQLASYAWQAGGGTYALADWQRRQQPVSALAGIALPQRFFAMLQQAGLTVAHTLALPDHAAPHEIQHAAQILMAYGLPVLCTEKDAVKLWSSSVPTPQQSPHATHTPLLPQMAQQAYISDACSSFIDVQPSSIWAVPLTLEPEPAFFTAIDSWCQQHM